MENKKEEKIELKEKNKTIKKGLKIIIIVLGIFLILLLVHSIRNYYIMANLEKNIQEYKNLNNFNMHLIGHEKNSAAKMECNYYEKGDNTALYIEKNYDGTKYKTSMYKDKTNTKEAEVFVDINDEPFEHSFGGAIDVKITSLVAAENTADRIINSIGTSIIPIKYEGKNCYKIINICSPNYFVKNKLIIEKDTGLTLEAEDENIKSKREYKFNNVDDKVFTKPDAIMYHK